ETTTTTIPSTTSTSIPETTTTSTLVTTTSTAPSCSCCTGTGRLAFTTGLASSGSNCGTVVDDTGANLLNLGCGGLYFRGRGGRRRARPGNPRRGNPVDEHRELRRGHRGDQLQRPQRHGYRQQPQLHRGWSPQSGVPRQARMPLRTPAADPEPEQPRHQHVRRQPRDDERLGQRQLQGRQRLPPKHPPGLGHLPDRPDRRRCPVPAVY